MFLSAAWILVVISGGLFAEEPDGRKYPRENPVVQAVKRVGSAVVNISSTYEVRSRVNPFFQFPMDPFFKDFFEPRFESRQKLTSLGSGVIIDGERGLILTNQHVIAGSASITVVLNDGREFTADVIGADMDSDLAMLRIPAEKPLPSISMGSSEDIMIGETVIAIGNPFGFANTVTTGVVSAVNRSIRTEDREFHDFIQTDASINPGNSGGPLLNINGELIGINTAIYAKAEGIGFAIPISKAQKIVSDLIAYGEVVPAWIGITLGNMDARLAGYLNLPAGTGCVVKHVEPDGPAEKAGIREGDILVSVDHRRISSTADYAQVMRSIETGRRVEVEILRKGEGITLSVVASVFPEALALDLAYRLLGIRVADIEFEDHRSQRENPQAGVVISEIDPRSFLAGIGVRAGDVIRQINETRVLNTEDFKKAVIRYRLKPSVVILLVRGGDGYYITVNL